MNIKRVDFEILEKIRNDEWSGCNKWKISQLSTNRIGDKFTSGSETWLEALIDICALPKEPLAVLSQIVLRRGELKTGQSW